MKDTLNYANFLASQNDEVGVNFFKDLEGVEVIEKGTYFVTKEKENEQVL